MAKIQIFARLRPTSCRYEGLQTTPTEFAVQIGGSGVGSDRHAKRPSTKYAFKFSRVFEENSSQSEIFETVSRRMVDRCVEGYNGTVFAYGQTSTGKTYTIEGSARRYKERGLIPRILSYLYDILEKRKRRSDIGHNASSNVQDKGGGGDGGERGVKEREEGGNEEEEEEEKEEEEVVKVHISYMEIYQDTGYDLLNPGTRPGSLMLTLPKVRVREGPGGMVVVRDLSVHEAATEQVALSLLFQGSTCRKVAETAMNQSSSRSHSVFTISLTLQQPGSEIILNSKLHLVDLAGSERVARMGLDGRLLQEAKYINLSLHHLEHVIVALHQQRRSSMGRLSRGHTSGFHIPYRNCMLTMVLRDSLGGNCLTSMIATVSAEVGNIWETISTLRFSQRVACIANNVRRNEELDDKAVIKKLKRRVVELERELASVKYNGITPSIPPVIDSDSERSVALTEADRKLCHRVLYEFFHGRIENPVEAGIKTKAMFHECLLVLRNVVLHSLPTSSPLSNSLPTTPSSSSSAPITSSPVTSFPTSSSATSTTRGSPCAAPATSFPLSPNHSTPPIEERVEEGEGYTGEDNHRYSSQKATKKRKKKKKIGKQRWDENTERNENKARLSTTGSTFTPFQYTPDPLIQSYEPTHTIFIPDNTTAVLSSSTASSRLSSGGIGSVANEETSFQSTLQKSDEKERGREEGERRTLDKGGAGCRHFKEGSGKGVGGRGRDEAESDGMQWAQRTGNPNFSPSPPNLFTSSDRTVPSTTLPCRDPIEHQLHSDPTAKGFNPEQSALRRLGVETGRLEKSKNEKAQLLSGVHLLSFRVEEEELRTQLSSVAEHLASQHARVLQLQQSSRVQAGPESDQLCAEKIAEQHLRIKQAKLHQRFLNIQQQINTVQTSPSKEGEAPTIRNPNSSSVPLRSSVTRIVNAATKTEVQNSKVQQEIERLRISQAEKDLELKEAITRRKLWDLKQHLLQSGTSSNRYEGTVSPNKRSTLITKTTTSNTTTAITDAISTATASTIAVPTSSRQAESGGRTKQSHIHYTAAARLDPSIPIFSDSSSYYPASKAHFQCTVQPYVYHSGSVDENQRDIGRAPHIAPQLVKHSPPHDQNMQHMIRSNTTPEKSNIPHNSSDDGRTYSNDKESCGKVKELYTVLKVQPAVETLLQRKSLELSSTKKHKERADEVTSSSTTCTTAVSMPVSSTPNYHVISNSENKTISDISENTQTRRNEMSQLVPSKNKFKAHPHPLQYSPMTTKSLTTNCTSPNNRRICYVAKNTEFLSPSNTSVYSKPSVDQCDTPENGSKSALIFKGPLSSSSLSNTTPQSQKQQRPRLTIPEEARETEYMGAVQRQRARVSRIRRCIAAATLIQRAWRKYREMKT